VSRTIVITGASDGIGAVAARELARRGDEVVIVGRNREKTAAVARDTGGAFHVADYARLDDVRALAAALPDRIDVLVNNAGAVLGDRKLTVDGYEQTFQVNHLGGFLLTGLLIDNLTAAGASVINTSSVAHRALAKFDIDDLQNERNYAPLRAYGNGKLANVLHAKELHRRYHAAGLSAIAVHPGNVATNFASETNHFSRVLYRTPLRKIALTTPEKGAEPLLVLAEGTPGQDWQSGDYWEKLKPGKRNPQADDAALAAALWERSAELVGLA
jgi:NAD(P)-dependent dehydrogenase (short-subunit alcohol dehydrogenase family)